MLALHIDQVVQSIPCRIRVTSPGMTEDLVSRS